jgi:hypothetical protein
LNLHKRAWILESGRKEATAAGKKEWVNLLIGQFANKKGSFFLPPATYFPAAFIFPASCRFLSCRFFL